MHRLALLFALLALVACTRAGEEERSRAREAAVVPPTVPVPAPGPELLLKPKHRPDDPALPPPRCPPQSVSLSAQGAWIGDGTRNRFAAACKDGLDLAAIATELCARIATAADCPAIEVAAAPGLAYQQIISVMDAANNAGLQDVAMTEPAQLSVTFPAAAAAGERLAAQCGDPVAACPGLRLAPQTAPASPTDLANAPLVTITPTGELTLDGKAVTADELPARLSARPRHGTALILQADRDADIKLINAVLHAAQDTGYHDVKFAVQRP